MDTDAATDNAQGAGASANQYASFGQKESHISEGGWPARCHRRPGPCHSREMASLRVAASGWPPRIAPSGMCCPTHRPQTQPHRAPPGLGPVDQTHICL